MHSLVPTIVALVLGSAAELAVCNEGPIIGVLAQSTEGMPFRNLKPENYSYIASSYVKAIEASGGRVVPVFVNKSTEYYEEIVNKVNGVLIPGGMPILHTDYGMTKSAIEIFRIAKRINNAKDYFPILGICRGLELLVIASVGEKDPLTDCDSSGVNLPLTLIPGMEDKSVLFKAMPKDVRNILLTEPVTANHHVKCITNDTFTSMNLDVFWNPITTNEDDNDLTFISIMEAKDYPFVGLQFHPEKNAYEWRQQDPHGWSAIYSARYFYDWFMNECRRNQHSYANQTALHNELVYNYPTTYIGKFNYQFEELYFFDE